MHQLTLVFGPTATTWYFLFKSLEAAEAAANKLQEARQIADDFGQTVSLDEGTQIHAVLLEDLAASMLARVELQLTNARTQIAYTEAASKDPKLATFARMQQLSAAGNRPIVPMGGIPRA